MNKTNEYIVSVYLLVLRAAQYFFPSITGVIQHYQHTFPFCHDGYIDRDILMSQVLPWRKLKNVLVKLSVCS